VTAHIRTTAWEILDVQLKCDLISLYNALDNEYAQHLLQGKPLPINYSSYICQQQVVTGSQFSVNVSRAFTRLKSVFVTLYRPQEAHFGITHMKEVNTYFHPMGDNVNNQMNSEIEFQMQIGSTLFPEYPIRSLAEAFYLLKKCLGINASAFHAIHLSRRHYSNTKFIIGIDTGKVLGSSFTGYNSRSGDLMTINIKNAVQRSAAAVATANTTPTMFYAVLRYDAVLNIQDTTVQVLE
jgi:hypothetical protein